MGARGCGLAGPRGRDSTNKSIWRTERSCADRKSKPGFLVPGNMKGGERRGAAQHAVPECWCTGFGELRVGQDLGAQWWGEG